MKNAFKALGIIALAVAIGFSMTVTLASCDDGGGGPAGNPGGSNPGTNPGGNTPSNTAGTMIITGLPTSAYSYGAAVQVYAQGTDISTNDAIGDAYSNDRRVAYTLSGYMDDNVATLVRDQDPPTGTRWTESGSFPVVLTIWDKDNLWDIYVATVSFSNGSATVPFSSFRYLGKF